MVDPLGDQLNYSLPKYNCKLLNTYEDFVELASFIFVAQLVISTPGIGGPVQAILINPFKLHNNSNTFTQST